MYAAIGITRLVSMPFVIPKGIVATSFSPFCLM